MSVKATVTMEKSFDDVVKELSKEWESKDFEKLFEGEGKYLDRLSEVVNGKGKTGEGFTVTYTVTVTKEN